MFSGRSGVSLYSGESLAFQLDQGDHYLVESSGVALHFPLGWRAKGSLFGEQATHTFFGAAARSEDLRSLGASASIPLRPRTSVELTWQRRVWEGARGRHERPYNRFTAGLNFGMGAAVTW